MQNSSLRALSTAAFELILSTIMRIALSKWYSRGTSGGNFMGEYRIPSLLLSVQKRRNTRHNLRHYKRFPLRETSWPSISPPCWTFCYLHLRYIFDARCSFTRSIIESCVAFVSRKNAFKTNAPLYLA